MNGTGFRNIILIVSVAAFLALLGICAFGFAETQDFDARLAFGATIVRSAVMFIFIVFYYSSLYSGLGLDSAFLPLFLLFSIISEFRILALFERITSLCPVSPVIVSGLLVFSYIMTGFSLFCFGYFYQERERSAVVRFLLLSISLSLILTLSIPRAQSVDNLATNLGLSILLSSLYGATGLLFLRHIIMDPPGSLIIRHFTALLFLAGNIVNIYFDSRIAVLGGTAYILVSYLTVIIISRISDIRY